MEKFVSESLPSAATNWLVNNTPRMRPRPIDPVDCTSKAFSHQPRLMRVFIRWSYRKWHSFQSNYPLDWLASFCATEIDAHDRQINRHLTAKYLHQRCPLEGRNCSVAGNLIPVVRAHNDDSAPTREISIAVVYDENSLPSIFHFPRQQTRITRHKLIGIQRPRWSRSRVGIEEKVKAW